MDPTTSEPGTGYTASRGGALRDDTKNGCIAETEVETGGISFLVEIVLDILVGFPRQQRPLFPVVRRVEYLC